MHLTSTRKMASRAGVALALTFGVLATGAGVAGASDHHHSSWSHDSGSSSDVSGVVNTASSTSITITERSGTTATFTIGSTTTITEGSTTVTAGALAANEHVVIVPSTTTAGQAASIKIRLSHLEGKVSSVSGNTITITGRDGLTESVVVGTTTTYTKGGATASLADVVTGVKIDATGVVNPTATALNALTVKISAPEVKQAYVEGKVAAVSGNNISVALPNGLTLLVVVSSTTTYTLNGATGALSDVVVGVYVRAAGTVDTTANALDAASVRIGGHSQGQDTSFGLTAHLSGSALGAGFGSNNHHPSGNSNGRRH